MNLRGVKRWDGLNPNGSWFDPQEIAEWWPAAECVLARRAEEQPPSEPHEDREDSWWWNSAWRR